MIKTILTILMIAALAYGIIWLGKNFTETRTQVQCKIDYGIRGCKETPDAK